MIMSAEDRLQALEQLLALQGDFLVARAAAQAEQRATDVELQSLTVRGEGVVDTRDNWTRFKFLGCARADDLMLPNRPRSRAKC